MRIARICCGLTIGLGALKLNGKEFLMGIFRDVTERKQRESALIESEKQHQAISELTTDFIYHH